MEFSGRYERNAPAITAQEQKALAAKSVLVAGCGGLGGYVIEFLGRTGIGHITAVDGDLFEESNLNRQLLATAEVMGRPKAQTARERMTAINPEVKLTAVNRYITAVNVDEIIHKHDVIVDALDNGQTRLILAAAARSAKIPVVSGAIGGWYGRVLVLYPEDNADFLWKGDSPPPAGNLCATAAFVASVQTSETLKILLGRPNTLRGRMLDVNMLTATWEEITLIS